MSIATYKNPYNHARATVEPKAIAPYYGAKKQLAYRLKVYDADGIMYHLSVFETLEELHKAITTRFGSGWKLEIKE